MVFQADIWRHRNTGLRPGFVKVFQMEQMPELGYGGEATRWRAREVCSWLWDSMNKERAGGCIQKS